MAQFPTNKKESITDYIRKPKKVKKTKDKYINYKNAEKLASEFKLKKNTRWFSYISGSFIFGDLIEALIVNNNWHCSELTISTLSLSEDNIYNLRNLLRGGFVSKMNLIVSEYFYSHERRKLVSRIYEELNEYDFNLSVAGIHAKTCTFKVDNANVNGFIVIQGSANMRSSDNIEQIQIEENEELYNYMNDFQHKIIEMYSTNIKVRGDKSWNLLNM